MREKIFTGLVFVLLISSCGGNGSGINPSFNPPVGEPSPIVRGIFDLQSSTCRTDGSQLSIVQNVRQVLMKGGFEYGQESFGGGYEVLGSIDHENVVKFTIEGESETLTCVATLLEPVFQGTCTLESGGTCEFVFSRATGETGGGGTSDQDGDSVPDDKDNCPAVANADQEDQDGNGKGDACETSQAQTDSDEDGVVDSLDNCPHIPNTPFPGFAQVDLDNDGVGNKCDDDVDGDGIPNNEDPSNCFKKGNSVDCSPFTTLSDVDGDGVDDLHDNCLGNSNPDQKDSNHNGIGDACAVDNNGNGLEDIFEPTQ